MSPGSKITFPVLVASPGDPQDEDRVWLSIIFQLPSEHCWAQADLFCRATDPLQGHWGLALWLEGSTWVWASLFSAIGVTEL